MDTALLATRSTNLRLLIAMGVSTVVVAATLTIDIGWRLELSETTGGQRLPLMIEITQPRTELMPVEISRKGRERLYDEPAVAPVEQERVEREPTRDWDVISSSFAERHVDDLERRDRALAEMWRQSPSVMFESENEFEVIEVRAVMADLGFIEPVGVIGLGFTLGSCFIGIPLAGVPVEERTAVISLWVCR